jgi:enediyne biosynthesis protein E4
MPIGARILGRFTIFLLCTSSLPFWSEVQAQNGPIRFEDVTDRTGVAHHLEAWEYGHGAAWGDVDADGRPDLYLGSFAGRADYRNRLPNMLLLNRPDGFALSPEEGIRYTGAGTRLSAAIFVDLDNDRDLDLAASNHVQRARGQPGSDIFENQGGGSFGRVTPDQDYWPAARGMRNIAAIDLNQDALVDLIMADGSYGRGAENRLFVLRNNGSFEFEDVTHEYGFPVDNTLGLGLAVGDVNDDGFIDVFVAGSNRLFVSRGKRTYREVQPGTFVLPVGQTDAFPAGADFGDLNGDGLLDLVTTVHAQPSRIHLYLHQGTRDGVPQFVEITEVAGVGDDFPSFGMTGLQLKNAFVQIRDIDSDGRNDVVLSIVYRDGDGEVQPLVLRNLGNEGGTPRFSRPPNSSLIGYYAAAPIGDYDRDGRLDLFLCPWFAETPAYLFRNTTPGGHWLAVQVEGDGQRYNWMGIGSTVLVYEAGGGGDPERLIQRREIAIGTGYSSGEEAIAYLGLGEADRVDVLVRWGDERRMLANVEADQYLKISFPR